MSHIITYYAVFVLEILMLSFEIQAQNCIFVVAKDNSGNFKTISEAINAISINCTQGSLIRVKQGLYEEYVIIPYSKTNVQLVGDGMHMTIVSGNRSQASGYGTDVSGTLSVYGAGFTAIGITFQNVAGEIAGQACALVTEADHLTFFRCRFLGYQDTIFTKSGTLFFRDCEVAGTIDFICGDGAVVFQNSKISVRNPLPHQTIITITAQKKESTDKNNVGTVFHECSIIPSPNFKPPKKVQTYLGRPWGQYSTTVVMRSYLDRFINPHGWLRWNSPTHVYYGEYHNNGLGANTKRRVRWSKVMNKSDALRFTVKNFIQGDKWIPKNVPCILGLKQD